MFGTRALCAPQHLWIFKLKWLQFAKLVEAGWKIARLFSGAHPLREEKGHVLHTYANLAAVPPLNLNKQGQPHSSWPQPLVEVITYPEQICFLFRKTHVDGASLCNPGTVALSVSPASLSVLVCALPLSILTISPLLLELSPHLGLGVFARGCRLPGIALLLSPSSPLTHILSLLLSEWLCRGRLVAVVWMDPLFRVMWAGHPAAWALLRPYQ